MSHECGIGQAKKIHNLTLALFNQKAPKGPSALTSPSDERIVFNSILLYAFMTDTSWKDLGFNTGTFWDRF